MVVIIAVIVLAIIGFGVAQVIGKKKQRKVQRRRK